MDEEDLAELIGEYIEAYTVYKTNGTKFQHIDRIVKAKRRIAGQNKQKINMAIEYVKKIDASQQQRPEVIELLLGYLYKIK